MKLIEAACSLKITIQFQNNKFNMIIQFVLHSSLKNDASLMMILKSLENRQLAKLSRVDIRFLPIL